MGEDGCVQMVYMGVNRGLFYKKRLICYSLVRRRTV